MTRRARWITAASVAAVVLACWLIGSRVEPPSYGEAVAGLDTRGEFARINLAVGGLEQYYSARATQQLISNEPDLEQTSGSPVGASCLMRSGTPSPSVMGDLLIEHWDTWTSTSVEGRVIRCH